MAWTWKYNSISAKPIIRQLMAIVQRDQRAALDHVGGTNVLPSFSGYYFSERPVKQFPALMLRASRRAFTREVAGTRQGTLEALAGVAVQHQDPEAAAELLYDYLEALAELFESFPLSDLSVPLTLTHPMFSGGSLTLTGLPATTRVTDVFVARDDSGALARLREGFATAGVVTLTIDVEEQQA